MLPAVVEGTNPRKVRVRSGTSGVAAATATRIEAVHHHRRRPSAPRWVVVSTPVLVHASRSYVVLSCSSRL